ncbi:MAG: DUF4332 domain-containing protein [Pseudomonadota bacterium]|nr:DUF4332 domain-containing protein [Pseudomonadota bacterium]
MGYPIMDIEGIGPKYASRLVKAGIKRTHHLLDKGASRQGRKSLADAAGVDEGQILKWTNMADLMRVKGVGEEYSELLEAAGVDTVKELRTRRADNLHEAIVAANKRRRLVRQIPGLRQVEKWVKHAKSLKPIVTY